ncbi:aldo/keto reductase [Dethiosulfovibrio acidaminovorans]|uniref:aldo/keto reductase n=1 Tax=Dethiosulfovibrio acidaminovorans TaxID=133535 RepID=UPI001F399E1A|nr:aldo/keto reductase [Dethiosulfovibrio acidaminovorans]MCF4114895.1 aldo/keto reductase [Dethiosulfovibrio russensis]
MIFEETYSLSNGVKIPKLGLGTWFIPDDQAGEAVRQAVELGYRHMDTAQAYENEAGVAAGVKSCGIEREKLFVTSKVAAEYKTYEAATSSIDETLSRMGLDYLDMMIIHSPQPWDEFRDERRYYEENKAVWRALEDGYRAGKLKAIGVSNFLVDDLESLLADCTVKPMVNQILAHIGNTPEELMAFCEKNDILVEAYAPIAHGVALWNRDLVAMAEKYGVAVPQLCIKYVLQLGTVALPKTANPAHMADNAKLDFTVSDEDMGILKGLSDMKDYGEFSFFPVFSGK